MIVFGPDSDAWLRAQTFPQRTGVDALIAAAGAFQNTAKSIYYWRFLVLSEVCA
jgi:hypothetical protein